MFGVEGPVWTETLGTMDDVEYMAFPRIAAVAEIGWTSAENRSWESFRQRLAAQGPRWSALGINSRRSPAIPWRE